MGSNSTGEKVRISGTSTVPMRPRQDETNDSYLARADVLWQELLNKEMKIEELQAYITLRGWNLSGEDKNVR